MEGFETGRPLYSTIDRYIFDLLWKGYKLKEYAIMGGRVLVKPLSLTLCWLGYMIFDKQEIIVSATSDPIVEEAWDKVVDTIKAIEKEYRGLSNTRW
jgi:hypothetical protein